MALSFSEFSELAERVGICDVLAIPSEEIIHFPNDRHRNVQGIAEFVLRNIASIKIKSGKFQAWLVDGKHAKRTGVFHPFCGMAGISRCDFVENDLRKDTVKTWHGILPPVPGDFLSGSHDDVSARAGHQVAQNCGFDIDGFHGGMDQQGRARSD